MYPDPQNPFAAAAQPASNGTPSPNNGAPVPNPFAAAASQQTPAEQSAAASPFAGMDTDSPFGLVDSSAGRPAKLPERRFPEAPQAGANGSGSLVNDQSPFERAGVTPAQQSGSPFEAVVGGPTEGFLAERPGEQRQGGSRKLREVSTTSLGSLDLQCSVAHAPEGTRQCNSS